MREEGKILPFSGNPTDKWRNDGVGKSWSTTVLIIINESENYQWMLKWVNEFFRRHRIFTVSK